MMVKTIPARKRTVSGGISHSTEFVTPIIILELMIKGRAVKRAPFLDGDIAKHC